MTSPLRRRSRRGEGDRLREELLAAAEDILIDDGEAGLTVRAVASRVGVSTPSVYLHFADKQALVDAVCLTTWEGLSTAMATAAATAPDPFLALRARGLAYVRFGLSNPEQYRVLLLRPHPDCGDPACPVLAAGRRAYDELTQEVLRCQATGVFAADDDARSLTLVLWSAVHGVVSLAINGTFQAMGDTDIDALAERAVDGAGLGIILRQQAMSEAGRDFPSLYWPADLLTC